MRISRHNSGSVCTLVLNRPEKLNALDTQFFEELDAHIISLEKETDTIGCVVLRAAGRAFCSGADLKAMGKSIIDPRFKPRIIERFSLLPQPTIAAVHGICVAGGLELALSCDFIIADTTAVFSDTHGKWGLVGAWGMAQRLPRRVGISAAKMIMMTGRKIDSDEALSLGLIDMLVDEGKLDARTMALASEIIENSWHTNFSTKAMLLDTDGMSLSESLAFVNYTSIEDLFASNKKIEEFSRNP